MASISNVLRTPYDMVGPAASPHRPSSDPSLLTKCFQITKPSLCSNENYYGEISFLRSSRLHGILLKLPSWGSGGGPRIHPAPTSPRLVIDPADIVLGSCYVDRQIYTPNIASFRDTHTILLFSCFASLASF